MSDHLTVPFGILDALACSDPGDPDDRSILHSGPPLVVLLVTTTGPNGPVSSEPPEPIAWHPLDGLADTPRPEDCLLLPQSFPALSRLLACHVGLRLNGDDVPRWEWDLTDRLMRLKTFFVPDEYAEWYPESQWAPTCPPSRYLRRSLFPRDDKRLRGDYVRYRRESFAHTLVYEARASRLIKTGLCLWPTPDPWFPDGTYIDEAEEEGVSGPLPAWGVGTWEAPRGR